MRNIERQVKEIENKLGTITAWPNLPEHTKAAIKALVNMHIKPEK